VGKRRRKAAHLRGWRASAGAWEHGGGVRCPTRGDFQRCSASAPYQGFGLHIFVHSARGWAHNPPNRSRTWCARLRRPSMTVTRQQGKAAGFSPQR